MLGSGLVAHGARDLRRREVTVREFTHEVRQQRASGAVAAGAVYDQVDADAVVDEEAQRAVEKLRIAVVPRDAPAVQVLFVEPEQHVVERRHDRELCFEDLPDCLGAEELRGAESAALQPGDHEASHVGGGGRRTAGGCDTKELEWLCRPGADLVALRHGLAHVRRQGLPRRRACHAERTEHVAVDVVVVGFAACALEQVAGERDAVVAVGGYFAGRKDPCGRPGLDESLRRHKLSGPVRDEALDGLLEAGRVRHQVAKRDRLAGARRNTEVEVIVDVAVKLEAPGLDLLHDRCPGEELADRTGAENRTFGIDAHSVRRVGVAVAALREDLAILDDHDGGARDVITRERVGEEALEPGLHVVAGQFA